MNSTFKLITLMLIFGIAVAVGSEAYDKRFIDEGVHMTDAVGSINAVTSEEGANQ